MAAAGLEQEPARASTRECKRHGLLRRALVFFACALGLVLAVPAVAGAVTFTVTKSADTNDGTCDADCSLREAVAAANALAGTDVIDFDAVSTDGVPIVLSLGQLHANESSTVGGLTIQGNGAGTTIIDGNASTRLLRLSYSSGATATVRDVTIRNGSDTDFGGGVYISVSCAIGPCTFNFVNSEITGNTSPGSGGGIFVAGSQAGVALNLTDSTVSYNHAGGGGGGIRAGAATVTLLRSTLSGNTSDNTGAGYFATGGLIVVTNSTVSGNLNSVAFGGGLAVVGATITNSTIVDNDPSGVQGTASPGGAITITDSIVANNVVEDCDTITPPLTANITSIDSDGTCGDAMTFDQPLVAPLASNGGPTLTHGLFLGSPAIDKVANCLVSTDQRGVARTLAGTCDAGAFEGNVGPPPLTVEVMKTAISSVVRTWVWSVAKYASHERVVLARKKDPDLKKDDSHLSRFAKQARVEYKVRASAESVDSEPRVSGVITVSVPGDAGGPAEITDVSDLVADEFAPEVRCEEELPVVLEVGESLACEYSQDLPDGTKRRNVAVATAQVPGEPDTQATFDSGPVTFDFLDPVIRKQLDTKARVYDSRAGFLGWVDADTQPTEFTYNVLVKPGGLAPLCGKGYVNNTASVVGNETGSDDAVSVRIPVEVLCFVAAGSDGKKSDAGAGDLKPGDPGVSVTRKGRIDGVLNSDFPPHTNGGSCLTGNDVKRGSKADPLWNKIGPNGKQTRFYKSKRSYRQALVAKGKNRYFRLSNQYVLAKLNVHAGAPIAPATTKALRFGDRYFASKAPNAKIGKKQKRAIAKHMKSLKRFNTMARGHHPPACAS